jgi:hypothetical protein
MDIVGEKTVCSDDDIDLVRGDVLEDLACFFRLLESREEGHSDREALETLLKGKVVL